MDVYLVDGRVVVLSEAEQRAVSQLVALLGWDLESAVRLAAVMQEDAPED